MYTDRRQHAKKYGETESGILTVYCTLPVPKKRMGEYLCVIGVAVLGAEKRQSLGVPAQLKVS
jgi:hypothetical protein